MTWLRAIAVLLLVSGCSGPDPDEREGIATPPRETFEPLGVVLGSHCGSLDCHGSTARNLRIYGENGLRIGGITGGDPTTTEELDATFLAVVMLEPETISHVVSEGGREPSRLTLVRKGRGTEAHKGDAPMPTGSAGDRCLTAWLASQPSPVECTDAAEIPRPDTAP